MVDYITIGFVIGVVSYPLITKYNTVFFSHLVCSLIAWPYLVILIWGEVIYWLYKSVTNKH